MLKGTVQAIPFFPVFRKALHLRLHTHTHSPWLVSFVKLSMYSFSLNFFLVFSLLVSKEFVFLQKPSREWINAAEALGPRWQDAGVTSACEKEKNWKVSNSYKSGRGGVSMHFVHLLCRSISVSLRYLVKEESLMCVHAYMHTCAWVCTHTHSFTSIWNGKKCWIWGLF